MSPINKWSGRKLFLDIFMTNFKIQNPPTGENKKKSSISFYGIW